ncbi:hypothetical protein HGRIS_013792 [Hohenbuehelia grisea]|uniref:NADH:flavin oxidoreductase/NADH oxidase N-terminal domain-containing protein n=1 Tax=Hohenbuehelia grisea TaxID=104357 RepID=A0ABR3IWN4_9AGAR
MGEQTKPIDQINGSGPHTLFQEAHLGARLALGHRVVLAPLTRFRTEAGYLPLPTVKEYYTQRASVPGTLLISEGIIVGPGAGSINPDAFPALHTEEQAKKWREITDAVHAKGSYMIARLFAAGRVADPSILAAHNPPHPFLGPSALAVPPTEQDAVPPSAPRAMTHEEIKQHVQLFVESARLAVGVAGFDGVELHCANGYLVDQFLQELSNVRDDEYGGSPEGRSRFPLEITEALVKAVGEERVGVRLSPWSKFQGMGMQDPIPTFSYFASELRTRFPSLAYLHAVEPRISGASTRDADTVGVHESIEFLRRIWAGPGRVFISAGGYTREAALVRAESSPRDYDGLVDLVAFGRWFISNPDLPTRLKDDLPIAPYNRATFYLVGDASGKGYTDYPAYTEADRTAGGLTSTTGTMSPQAIACEA